MSQSEKKQSTKVPTNKECGACLCRGYNLSSTCLGGGAISRVFLATPGPKAIQNNPKLQIFFNKSQSPKVAIKVIYFDKGAGKVKEYVEELASEVESLNTMLGNRKIMQLLDAFICCKRIFLVTEFVSGGGLEQMHPSIVGRGRAKNVMEEGLTRYHFEQLVNTNKQVILYGSTNSQHTFEREYIRHVSPDNKNMKNTLYVREGLSKGFRLTATFLRSYSLQQAKVLPSYETKLRKRLPKTIYVDFGLPICVTRREVVNEFIQIGICCFKSLSICSESEEANSVQGESSVSVINSNLAARPGYEDLSLSCIWASIKFNSTPGVVHVKRIVKVTSISHDWALCRYINNPSINELDKYIQLYNTTDLDVQRSWSLPYPISFPEDVYCQITCFQSSDSFDVEKLSLAHTKNIHIDPSYLFAHYNRRALHMKFRDLQMIQEKELPTLDIASASETHNIVWPTPLENQEAQNLQVSDMATRIITEATHQIEQEIVPTGISRISLTMAAIKDDKDNCLKFFCKSELFAKSLTDSNNTSIITFSSHMDMQEKINSSSLKISSNTLTQLATKYKVEEGKTVLTKQQVTLNSFVTIKDVIKNEIKANVIPDLIQQLNSNTMKKQSASMSSTQKSSILIEIIPKHKTFNRAIKQCQFEDETNTTTEEIKKHTQLLRSSIKRKKQLELVKRQGFRKTPCFKICEKNLPATFIANSTSVQTLRKKIQTENKTVKLQQLNTSPVLMITALTEISDSLIEIKSWIENHERDRINLCSYASTLMKKTQNSKKEQLLSHILSDLLDKSEQSEKNHRTQTLQNQNNVINRVKRSTRNSISASTSASCMFDEQHCDNSRNLDSVTTPETPLSKTVETEPSNSFFRKISKRFRKPQNTPKDDSVNNKKQPNKRSLFRRCFCIC